MTVTIQKATYGQQKVRHSQGIIAYLTDNNWDDFGYKSLFSLSIEDEAGNVFHIGDVKIGFAGQPRNSWTLAVLQDQIPSLDERFFSLGQDSSYYKKLSELPAGIRSEVLAALRDVVSEPGAMEVASSEAGQHVFNTSLMRVMELSTVKEQFTRILDGGAVLTPFFFGYQKQQTDSNAGVSLEFIVRPDSNPSTNIHVLIGRNGIGKTTLLNNMISCLVEERTADIDVGDFYDPRHAERPVNNRYFTSVVSSSFSAFDPFTPPPNRNAETDAIRYTYIGLKEVGMDAEGQRVSRHKDIRELAEDFKDSLNACLSLEKKKERWLAAIERLASDSNFAEMQLERLADEPDVDRRAELSKQFFTRMSSGHAVVLLTLTKLVERAEEKTLVLMDEPESHLHPPLLSAFIRALSKLLTDRNSVAIIATHSPVILQEVPKLCVWKLRRTRLQLNADRPEEETFGENAGTLTRDVFGLEVARSGFYDVLNKEVEHGKTYEEIISDYQGQIGFEGKVLLRALVRNRDAGEDEL